MLIFANTVDPHELVQLQKFIEVDGVTMNPSMIAEAALSNLGAVITDILSCLSGTVFVQVACRSTEEGVAAGSALASISPRIHVKVPCTKVGSEVIRQLTSQGVQCNGTLCFSGVQALLAAKSGATSISVFLNRLNAAGRDGTGALNSITSSVRNYLIPLKIIAASLKGRDDIPLHEIGKKHIPGLVIAEDDGCERRVEHQDHARTIAKLLRDRIGTVAEVVTSDDPTASHRISRFADGIAPWLVAVRMVSEGVDIPRLSPTPFLPPSP